MRDENWASAVSWRILGHTLANQNLMEPGFETDNDAPPMDQKSSVNDGVNDHGPMSPARSLRSQFSAGQHSQHSAFSVAFVGGSRHDGSPGARTVRSVGISHGGQSFYGPARSFRSGISSKPRADHYGGNRSGFFQPGVNPFGAVGPPYGDGPYHGGAAQQGGTMQPSMMQYGGGGTSVQQPFGGGGPRTPFPFAGAASGPPWSGSSGAAWSPTSGFPPPIPEAELRTKPPASPLDAGFLATVEEMSPISGTYGAMGMPNLARAGARSSYGLGGGAPPAEASVSGSQTRWLKDVAWQTGNGIRRCFIQPLSNLMGRLGGGGGASGEAAAAQSQESSEPGGLAAGAGVAAAAGSSAAASSGAGAAGASAAASTSTPVGGTVPDVQQSKRPAIAPSAEAGEKRGPPVREKRRKGAGEAKKTVTFDEPEPFPEEEAVFSPGRYHTQEDRSPPLKSPSSPQPMDIVDSPVVAPPLDGGASVVRPLDLPAAAKIVVSPDKPMSSLVQRAYEKKEQLRRERETERFEQQQREQEAAAALYPRLGGSPRLATAPAAALYPRLGGSPRLAAAPPLDDLVEREREEKPSPPRRSSADEDDELVKRTVRDRIKMFENVRAVSSFSSRGERASRSEHFLEEGWAAALDPRSPVGRDAGWRKRSPSPRSSGLRETAAPPKMVENAARLLAAGTGADLFPVDRRQPAPEAEEDKPQDNTTLVADEVDSRASSDSNIAGQIGLSALLPPGSTPVVDGADVFPPGYQKVFPPAPVGYQPATGDTAYATAPSTAGQTADHAIPDVHDELDRIAPPNEDLRRLAEQRGSFSAVSTGSRASIFADRSSLRTSFQPPKTLPPPDDNDRTIFGRPSAGSPKFQPPPNVPTEHENDDKTIFGRPEPTSPLFQAAASVPLPQEPPTEKQVMQALERAISPPPPAGMRSYKMAKDSGQDALQAEKEGLFSPMSFLSAQSPSTKQGENARSPDDAKKDKDLLSDRESREEEFLLSEEENLPQLSGDEYLPLRSSSRKTGPELQRSYSVGTAVDQDGITAQSIGGAKTPLPPLGEGKYADVASDLPSLKKKPWRKRKNSGEWDGVGAVPGGGGASSSSSASAGGLADRTVSAATGYFGDRESGGADADILDAFPKRRRLGAAGEEEVQFFASVRFFGSGMGRRVSSCPPHRRLHLIVVSTSSEDSSCPPQQFLKNVVHLIRTNSEKHSLEAPLDSRRPGRRTKRSSRGGV